jgi:U32 family peptidase
VLELESVDVHLNGDLIVPMRELNQMRRQAAELLVTERERPRAYVKRQVDAYGDAPFVTPPSAAPQAGQARSELTVLCRNLEQVEAAVQTDVEMIYADFEFIKQFPAAVEACRGAGKKIALATPRIHMPGETGYFKNILKLGPDAVLVRNTGAVYWFMRYLAEHPDEPQPELIGDFSLNVANHKAVSLFTDAGLSRVTPSYDLDIQQMVDLLRRSDTSRLEVVIHQHMPMFHTEHCVYCTFMSPGTDYTNCGRPCEEQRASLRDRVGFSHPVRVDEGCRNTVYNAIDQSGAEYLANFMELGVSRYRIEFLEESPDKVHEVIALYQRAIRGEVSGTQVWKTLKSTNQLGVTRGQLVK